MSDGLAHFLRITGYGYGLLVSAFALRFWITARRRPIGIALSAFSLLAYLVAFGFSLEAFLISGLRAPFFVTLMALLTLGYVNPTLIILLMWIDVRDERQRLRAMELAEELGIDPLMIEEAANKQRKKGHYPWRP